MMPLLIRAVQQLASQSTSAYAYHVAFYNPNSLVGGIQTNGSSTVFRFTQAAWISGGTGSPAGVVSAPVGSIWLRTDGGAGTTLYVKESGTGNTGWVAK